MVQIYGRDTNFFVAHKERGVDVVGHWPNSFSYSKKGTNQIDFDSFSNLREYFRIQAVIISIRADSFSGAKNLIVNLFRMFNGGVSRVKKVWLEIDEKSGHLNFSLSWPAFVHPRLLRRNNFAAEELRHRERRIRNVNVLLLLSKL